MKSLKEDKIGMSTTGIISLFILGALIVGFMGVTSMPQMIGPVYAQSDRASERACPVEGYTLERGECTADLIFGEPECIPSSVGGVKTEVVPGGEFKIQCGATLDGASGSDSELFIQECEQIGGTLEPVKTGIRCTFPITFGEPTCPGGVIPTEEGECITKPGRGNNPI